jgi:hypothetical protein
MSARAPLSSTVRTRSMLRYPLRVLVYKRTHHGDPDPNGQFGINDCMGQVRGWGYDAVVGIGGISAEPRRAGIAGKVTWIGIGPHKRPGNRGPIVTFDHFLHEGSDGPPFVALAPRLADHVYRKNVRAMVYTVENRRDEMAQLLRRAEQSPPSGRRRKYGPKVSGCRPWVSRKRRCPPSSC